MGPSQDSKRLDICGTFLTTMTEGRTPGSPPTAVNVMRDLAGMCEKLGLDVPPSVLSECAEMLMRAADDQAAGTA